MKNTLNTVVVATFVAIVITASGIASAAGNFVAVSLPKGVSIEIPKNWVVLSGNQRVTLDSAVESRLDLSGIDFARSDLPFAANLYDDGGKTIGILNIRYYPALDITQADARAATTQEVVEFDAILKENMLKSLKAFNITVTSWNGTRMTSINGITIFLTEYQRNALVDTGEFRVRLARVFSGDQSFTLTVSYHESAAILLQPITDRIISSLTVDHIAQSNSVVGVPSTEVTPKNTTIMETVYGEQWWLMLMYSFLITYSVGLAPPLLIRFAVMRRPMSKGWAIGTVALLWAVNIVLFTALGSQSKSHGALVLVAFLSYAILRKGLKKQTELA